MPNIPVPGDMEGFGIVMLEAALNGLPVIASRLEGIEEVICEGENGSFVTSGDAAGFQDAIREAVQTAHGLDEWGRKARAYTEATFRWDAIAERYVDLLESCPGNGR